MKTITLTDQQALDLYQALVMTMKMLDEKGEARYKDFSDRLEEIVEKIK